MPAFLMDRMIARFCLVWLSYWFIFLVQPVESAFPSVEVAWLIQFSFVIAVTVSFSIVQRAKAPRVNCAPVTVLTLDTLFALSVVKAGYLISLIGLTFLIYDKVIVQGIDYSSGIAFAREQWRLLGEERAGRASSIYSGIGYLTGSAYFLSLAVTFSKRLAISDRQRLRLMVVGFGLLTANSLITGGRSGVLLAFAFVSYAFFNNDFPERRTLFCRRKYRITPLIIVSLGLAYALFVFIERATVGDIDVALYSLNFLGFLGLDVHDWFDKFVNSVALGWLIALINLAVSYLTHSFATMAAIVDFEGDGGIVIFGYPMSLLTKLGLTSGDSTDWFLTGRFPSLPGGLYHQFGFLGMLLFSLVLGSLSGWTRGSYKWRRNSILALFVCSIFESILLISPFLFVGDFLFFPFLISGGVLSLVVVGLARRTAT